MTGGHRLSLLHLHLHLIYCILPYHAPLGSDEFFVGYPNAICNAPQIASYHIFIFEKFKIYVRHYGNLQKGFASGVWTIWGTSTPQATGPLHSAIPKYALYTATVFSSLSLSGCRYTFMESDTLKWIETTKYSLCFLLWFVCSLLFVLHVTSHHFHTQLYCWK